MSFSDNDDDEKNGRRERAAQWREVTALSAWVVFTVNLSGHQMADGDDEGYRDNVAMDTV